MEIMLCDVYLIQRHYVLDELPWSPRSHHIFLFLDLAATTINSPATLSERGAHPGRRGTPNPRITQPYLPLRQDYESTTRTTDAMVSGGAYVEEWPMISVTADATIH